ncbi:MAG: flagellar biosynthesis anti-sigma factor FlgM [Rhodocyclaceae bacterium]|nr:flagellar biosynthesis anti-sigma factor FlgM [Rhodocyclaceae bacterium]
MKIDSNIKSVGSPLGGTAKPANGAAPRPSATPAGEQVALSHLSARLQEIEGKMGDTAVVDAARVAEIKQAITDGQFRINPERIADGLLDSVRQMLAAHH